MSTNGNVTTPKVGTSVPNLVAAPEMVNLIIDGKPVSVPKGTNVVEAAKSVGIEIPHYCYHQHLSIAGNCRMCQVKVKGARKMDIACNLAVKEGMDVETNHTNKEVADTQAANLEFILINHPLDCTVCDQAGQCKLQDYHYEYNAKPSRFIEEKEHKVKAKPLGPTVMLDGERCIMCTRCIRFCDEVTGTSELGMLNRGDRSVIAVHPGKELTNPLSGTVVDLCPVGALTHREWRFNTRIWFTQQTDSICPGCSTGCNVKVAVRDREVVQVKARLNSDVNKEWLCDEGRYGFHRFLPQSRVTKPLYRGGEVTMDVALTEVKKLSAGPTLVLVSPDLLLEEYYLLKLLTERGSLKGVKVVLAYKERMLTSVEQILMSPDYAPNFNGALFSGIVGGDLAVAYQQALSEVKAGKWSSLLLIGDNAIGKEDIDGAVEKAIHQATISVALLTDREGAIARSAHVVLPARSILEKSGLMINRKERIQVTQKVVESPEGTEPHWKLLNRIADALGGRVSGAMSDRELTLAFLASEPRLAGLTIGAVKRGGVDLKAYRPGLSNEEEQNTKGVTTGI